jgi:hypothetical protein
MEYRLVLKNTLGVALVVVLGIGASVVTSTVVASRAYVHRGRQGSIQVKGYARKRVESDLGVWRIEVAGEGPTLADAFARLDISVRRIERFLAEHGFPGDAVALGAIDTTTHHSRTRDGRATRDVEGYTLSRRFVVTSGDVTRIARAAGEVTSLLGDGVQVRSRPPEFTCSRIGAIKIDILGDAAGDARRRAEEIAHNAGSVVGEVLNSRMGVLQITRPHSTDVSSYGIYDTTTIPKDVSVVVTAEFAIEEA